MRLFRIRKQVFSIFRAIKLFFDSNSTLLSSYYGEKGMKVNNEENQLSLVPNFCAVYCVFNRKQNCSYFASLDSPFDLKLKIERNLNE